MKKTMFCCMLLLSLLTLLQGLSAQEYPEFDAEHTMKRILLVPFDPRIYLNDATAEIAAVDKLTHDEIMQFFRHQLDEHLYMSMMDSCEIVDLFSNNTREDQDDLDSLYTIVGYKLLPAMPIGSEDADDDVKLNIFQRRKLEKQRRKRAEEQQRYQTHIEKGELVGLRQTTDDMFTHIVFSRPEVLAAVAKRRHIDYFLYINEFNIKGDYRDPYISGRADAAYIFKVHFSLFNAKGMLIHGGFGKTKIPMFVNDKQEIVNNYFPEVIRQIMRTIKF